MLSVPSVLLSWFLAVLLSGAATDAPRCDCDPLSTPEAFEQAAYVFTGRVVSGEVAGLSEQEMLIGGYGGVNYRFVVDEVFKGAVPDTVEVRGGPTGVWCMYDFSIGLRYLVFAFHLREREADVYYVPYACTPTDRLDGAEDEEMLAYLRTLRQ
ncbi:MAG TPA: hypothetical protein VK002_02035 [Rubricoccaceae bacterium]|jgi:hypothetical protein|nr:hypothetical protein [Rubricoccaceae bacterium]